MNYFRPATAEAVFLLPYAPPVRDLLAHSLLPRQTSTRLRRSLCALYDRFNPFRVERAGYVPTNQAHKCQGHPACACRRIARRS